MPNTAAAAEHARRGQLDPDDWRTPLTHRLLWMSLLVLALGAGLTVVMLPTPERWLPMLAATGLPTAAVLLVTLLVLRQRVSQRAQALVLVACLLVPSFLLYASVGFLSGGAVGLSAALLLSGLLLGRREMAAVFALIVAAITVIGYCAANGYLHEPPASVVSFRSGRAWLRTGVAMLGLMALLGATVMSVMARIESALERARREMKERERAEQERLQALRMTLEAQKAETIGRLAGGFAHDFNNNLFVVGMCASVLTKEDQPPDQRRESARVLQDALAQATALASQLLTLSRKHVPSPSHVTLSEAIESSARALRRFLPTDIAIRAECHTERAIYVDALQLQQALLNLAINARDAMPRGGTLTVRASERHLEATEPGVNGEIEPGHWITIEVVDTGSGMDAATAQRAFEPLFTTKGAGKGTGLGLFTVQTFAELANGHVSFSTGRDRGTHVTLWFPQVQPVERPAIVTRKAGGPARLAGVRVLLAEDARDVRNVIARALQAAGAEVHCAENGDDALALVAATSGAIDLLCTDVVMPGAPVSEVLARFETENPGVPVLIVSGYVGDELARRGILEGRYKLLRKPVGEEQLIESIATLYREARPHHTYPLSNNAQA